MHFEMCTFRLAGTANHFNNLVAILLIAAMLIATALQQRGVKSLPPVAATSRGDEHSSSSPVLRYDAEFCREDAAGAMHARR
jgi:hypothetical protein